MGDSLEHKPTLRRQENLKSKVKTRLEKPFGQPYLDHRYERRKPAVLESKAKKGDELVRHMSNLPNYLQRFEGGENTQGQALNFGVLDWKRLEKWKHKEKQHEPTTKGKKAPNPPRDSRFVSSYKETFPKSVPRSHRKEDVEQQWRHKSSSSIHLELKRKDSNRRTKSKSEISFPESREKTKTPQNIVLLTPKNPKRRTSFDEKLTESKKNSLSEHECLEKNDVNGEPSTTTETSMSFDQDMSEQLAVKGRHPSPSRRFSFSSLSRMSRSISFKEGSTVPQLGSAYTTVKSGPVSSSTGLDSSSRAKSSPLRRLLDPLLKPKGVAHSSTESSPVKRVSTIEMARGINREASAGHALLHVMVQNGFPFLKLVVNTGTDILAAALKKIPILAKGDSDLVYAFYSVNEVKKKSGSWISQSVEGKVYNPIGEMKISSCKDGVLIRQSVLYSVDAGLVPDRELAAIVVESYGEESSDKGKNKTTVILPGGVHGFPNTGLPSSLIDRWRSGGLCDCGGWDEGCKLQILSRNGPNGERLDRFDLFVQGGNHEKKPILSLEPFRKGLFSVEFNKQISPVQAFSICVAIITSHNPFKLSEMGGWPEGKIGVKTPAPIRVKFPAKYIPFPPASPVGRV